MADLPVAALAPVAEPFPAATADAAEPVILAYERARFAEVAKDFPEPFRGLILQAAAEGDHP